MESDRDAEQQPVSRPADRPARGPASTPTAQPWRADDDACLLRRHRRARDAAALEELVDRYTPLADALAVRHGRGAGSLAGVRQIAALALLRAIERHDDARGIPFAAYAARTITCAIERYLDERALELRLSTAVVRRACRVERAIERLSDERGRAPTVSEIVAALGDVDESDVLEALYARRAATLASAELRCDGARDGVDEAGASSVDGIEHTERRIALDALLQILGPAERVIVRLRFVDELSQAEIGRLVGLSHARIARIVSRAVARMRCVSQLPG